MTNHQQEDRYLTYMIYDIDYEPVPKGGTQKWDICSKNQTPELFITG